MIVFCPSQALSTLSKLDQSSSAWANIGQSAKDKIVNINDDCYTYFNKIINISNYEETNKKIIFLKKENDKFVEYLDLVKEL